MDSAQWGKTVQLFCYFGSSLATFWKTATDEKKFSIYEQIQTFQSRWEKHNNYITFVEEGIVETALIPLKIQINHSGKTFICWIHHPQSYWTIYLNSKWSLLKVN